MAVILIMENFNLMLTRLKGEYEVDGFDLFQGHQEEETSVEHAKTMAKIEQTRQEVNAAILMQATIRGRRIRKQMGVIGENPEDWEECVDDDGETFYYNTKTGETVGVVRLCRS